jgi:glycosyltransferase involved in cell wall biosynthesis
VGAVSAFERDLIAQRFRGPIEILPFAIAADPTPASHGERNGLLFVGAIEDRSPNEDALLWFVREMWAFMSPEQRAAMPIRHAGVMTSQQLRAYADRVTFLGAVPDLRPVYNEARIFVAPTRFAAGLPQKVYEAAANGLPVIASPLLAKQLGWTDGVELLVPQTPGEWVAAIGRLNADATLWMQLRDAALQRVRAEVDPAAFASKARRLVRSVLRSPAVSGSGASSD